MLEPSHIVVKPFKSLKTFNVSIKRIFIFTSLTVTCSLTYTPDSRQLKNTFLEINMEGHLKLRLQ